MVQLADGSTEYLLVQQIGFRARSQEAAEQIALHLRDQVEEELEQEEGDEVTIVELIAVTPLTTLTPLDKIRRLREARNVLLETKLKDCYVVAQTLDQMAHALEHRIDADFVGPALYDYSKFIEVAERVWKGENPLD
jgi:hypothetical protein